jgi:1-acyl-sn-glycerol-3-phosphate acyltransferase
VDGTREICSSLMEDGQPILVYPGGGHEVLKKKTDPRYTLMWKKRAGFAKLAVQHGYTIIPCCSVGTEDMLDVLVDIPADWFRADLSIPLIQPVSPSKIQKVYFWFGEPIRTSHLQSQWNDDDVVWEIREQTRVAVESGIQQMLEYQKKDPFRHLKSRLAHEFVEKRTQINLKMREIFNQIYGQSNEDQNLTVEEKMKERDEKCEEELSIQNKKDQ